jgi:hypothetical protein
LTSSTSFVRPLGNLVILFGRAEATLLEASGRTYWMSQKETQRFLQITAAEAKQELIPLARARGTEGFDLHELSEGIENYFCDRERRNRLMHDEWNVSLLRGDAVPRNASAPGLRGPGARASGLVGLR